MRTALMALLLAAFLVIVPTTALLLPQTQKLEAPTPLPPSQPDPVATLQPILKHMREVGTDPVVREAEGGVEKVQRRATNLRYDVRKSDSLVSPFLAVLYWDTVATVTGPADAVENLAKAKTETRFSTGWSALLAFQDNCWVVKDVLWDMKIGDRTIMAFSLSSKPDDALHEWKQAMESVQK